MRRLVAYVLTTLDGAVDDPNRMFPGPEPDEDPGPPTFDDQLIEQEAALIGGQTSVLLGRRTYEQWSRFWPTSDDQPFADFINRVDKHVATSRESLELPWGPAQRLALPLGPAIDRLKRQPGGDIGVHGSIALTQHLLAEGLLDELHLAIAPVLDPLGRRLFETIPGLRRLELVRATPTSSGALWTVYRPRETR